MQVKGRSASGVMAAMLGPDPRWRRTLCWRKGASARSQLECQMFHFSPEALFPKFAGHRCLWGGQPFNVFRKSGAAVPFADEF